MYYEKHPYKPTLAHKFVKELDQKNQLSFIFTQNIDNLEKECGISSEKIVQCHGAMDLTICTGCGSMGEISKFKEYILNMDQDSQIQCQKCNSLVKPNVVFFGEQLPDRYHALSGNIRKSDLVIVMGTSLKVFPVASMIFDVKQGTPIMVINQELPERAKGFDENELVFVQGNIEESLGSQLEGIS